MLSDPSPPSLDTAALARLRELDPDGRHGVVRRVLSAFEASLVRMPAQLAAAEGDADAVAVIAHTMKSGAASVGAAELAQLCAEVEKRLRGGDHAHLSSDIERLLAAAERAQIAVRTMLQP